MESRRITLIVVWAGWLLAWGLSFHAFWTTEPTGDSFIRGLNRVLAFLGWQGIAAMFALAIWGTGRGWPRGSSVRRWSRFPLGLSVLLAGTILGLLVWARTMG